ncbi:MAG: hypothetical protein II101_02560, partial [Ruminococcus sp.]|nr:hypothetical protein [Ruminococcus sp.]
YKKDNRKKYCQQKSEKLPAERPHGFTPPLLRKHKSIHTRQSDKQKPVSLSVFITRDTMYPHR